MVLLSRVSAFVSRTGSSSRKQLLRFRVPHNSKPCRNVSTETGQKASSKPIKSHLDSISSVILGTSLVAAGAGTVYFTYLRYKNSGWHIGVAANTIMDDGLHPAEYPWPNKHPFATFDHNRYATSSSSWKG
jgi:hypothetical protein